MQKLDFNVKNNLVFMPRSARVSDACFMIGQSDFDPIIIPTSICDLFILKK